MADKTGNDWRGTLKQRLTAAFCVLIAWSARLYRMSEPVMVPNLTGEAL